MNIVFYTRYDKLGSSSRYRFYNFRNYFNNNFNIKYYPFFNNSYLKNKYINKNNIINIFFCYLRRLYYLLVNSNNSIFVIEKELMPYFPFFFEKYFLKKKKYILDFDDAIYLNYKKNIFKYFFLDNKIEKLSIDANQIIVGSDNLKKYFLKYNNKINLIPTVVENSKYKKIHLNKFSTLTLVWIGTPSTAKYLESLLTVFIKLKKKYKINIISIGADLNNKNIIPYEWSNDTEIQLLKKSHIGLMPLFNDEWSKSKCGFKILQYMASELPVIASNIGQNKKIVSKNTGFLVNEQGEWFDKIELLINDEKLRYELGQNGYKKLKSEYTYNVVFPNLLKILMEV